MSSESDLASLIAAIYEAGMDFSLWPYVLGRIATAFDAPSAGMARQGETLAECWGFSSGVELEYERKYLDYYHTVNPIWQRASSTPAGTVQTDTMVMPRSELSRTEFFNDFLTPQRMGSMLNAVVLMEQGRQTIVSVRRNRQFEADDVKQYKLLAPHLQRAVQINIKLARAEFLQVASLAALSRLDEGVLFVKRDATVVFANKAAENFFANRDLRQSKGQLHGNSAAETANLHAVIAKCAEPGFRHGPGGLVSLSRAPGRSPLSLLIAPVPFTTPHEFIDTQPMAIIFVADPERSAKPDAVQLQKEFGMTPAEARFAIEILKGDGIQAAADRLLITRATARTHLARIFEKTGTRRQAELVGILLAARRSPGR